MAAGTGIADNPRPPGIRGSHGPIHLYDEPRRQGGPAEAPHPARHLAVILPGRQDRRAGPERLGQVDAAADHGGRRYRHRGRGPAATRDQGRPAAAGAAARRGCRRALDRRGVGEAGEGRDRPARAGLRALQRAGRRLRQARHRTGPARGFPRERRRPQPRSPARRRGGRAPPAALGGESVATLRRRAQARCAMPPPALEARHAAARRADQPPRRGVGRLAREVPRAVPEHGHLRDPRPLLPRQRRGLDPRARSRPRNPLAGQLFLLARAEGAPPRAGGEAAGRPPAHARARARVGARQPEGPPGQEQGATPAVRGALFGRVPGAQRDERDLHPAGTAPRRPRDRGRGLAQGLRRAPADRRPLLPPAAGRHRRHHRPERRRQDDAVSHADRLRAAGRGHDPYRPDRADRLCRPVARQARRLEDRLAGDFRRPGHHQGRQLRNRLARLSSAGSTSEATSSSSRSASFRAASGTACTSRSC